MELKGEGGGVLLLHVVILSTVDSVHERAFVFQLYFCFPHCLLLREKEENKLSEALFFCAFIWMAVTLYSRSVNRRCINYHFIQ